jgi:hypothetical protein
MPPQWLIQVGKSKPLLAANAYESDISLDGLDEAGPRHTMIRGQGIQSSYSANSFESVLTLFHGLDNFISHSGLVETDAAGMRPACVKKLSIRTLWKPCKK